MQTTQNKLIRFILQLPARSHVGYHEFKNSGMLPVSKRVSQLQLNHVFNIVHAEAPNYLKTNFNFSNINTRSSTLSFSIPSVKSQHFGKSTFNFTAIKAWNALPEALKHQTSKQSFKRGVKSYLLQAICDDENNIYTT